MADPGSVSLNCELRFKVMQVDATTGELEGGDGFDEEYPLEALEISTNDYMAKVSLTEFRRVWDGLATENEVLGKYALQPYFF